MTMIANKVSSIDCRPVWQSFGFAPKPISPVVGSALIGAGASVLGGLLGSSNQSSANKTNLRIAQMNNEFNERMLQKQMDYNTEMWEKQTDYDSAVNQRKRLEEAGLNPYLMMNGGSAGSVSSQSSPSTPTASPVQVQPNSAVEAAGMVSSIGGAISQLLNAKSQQKSVQNLSDYYSALTDQVLLENKYKSAEILSDIGLKNSQQQLNMQNRSNALMQYYKDSFTFDSYVQQAREDANNAHQLGLLYNAQTISEQLKAGLTYKELSYFDDKMQADLAVAGATAYSLYASGACSYSAAQNYVANSLKVQEETKGIKIDNATKRKVQKYVINSAFWNNRNEKWTALETNGRLHIQQLTKRQMGADYWNPFNYVGKALGGSASYNYSAGGNKMKLKPVKGFGR